MQHLKVKLFLYLEIIYLFYDFFGYVGNVNFYKQAYFFFFFFTNNVFVKQFTAINDVSNCKPMIIIQNVYSLTEIV